MITNQKRSYKTFLFVKLENHCKDIYKKEKCMMSGPKSHEKYVKPILDLCLIGLRLIRKITRNRKQNI